MSLPDTLLDLLHKNDAPSKKKPSYPINASLRSYLREHGREVKLPVSYDDLARITYSVALKDKNGERYFLGESGLRYAGVGIYT